MLENQTFFHAQWFLSFSSIQPFHNNKNNSVFDSFIIRPPCDVSCDVVFKNISTLFFFSLK